MPTPPEFLRSMLDGANEASFVVLSTGTIWHMNEPARRMFHVVDGRSLVPVSTYLSFCTAHAPNREILQLSWENVTSPNLFINNKRNAEGIGTPTSGGRFPVTVTVNLVSVASAADAPEETRTRCGQSSASDTSGRQNHDYYCLYIQDITPARLQIASLEEEVTRLSATKNAIIRASSQLLMIIDDGGSIQSVSSGLSQVFGYDQDSIITSQNVNALIQERGGNLVLEDHDRREVQGRHDDGSIIDLEVSFSRISTGNTAIVLKNITETKERKRLESPNEKLSPGLEEERPHILDAASRKTTQQKLHDKNILAELTDQKNITRGIFDASFDALFVINEQGIIQEVNETSTVVFGWTKEEFLGSNINILMTSRVAAEHDQYLQNYLETGIKKMIGTQREVTAQRKDKSTFTCVLGLSQMRDTGLFCGFIRDLTSEKAAQSEIIESHEKSLKILDASFDALFCINERGIISQVNTASSRVFGWTEEEFIGRNINMIMPDGHARKHDSYLKHYLLTGFKKMMGKQREVEGKRKDGTFFPCILGLSELPTNGDGPRQFVGFIKDVTVQKNLLLAEAEREASDSLLHNILPEHIAHRLKQEEKIADHYENTTILFADIVGFTARATLMSPHDVVTMLNDIFSRFDVLVGRYDLNKVKTIGDCYMVTSIPSSDLEHDGCTRVCRFALDLMKAIRAFNSTGPQHGHIELRVGIACGQVVAGVVGTKRLLFDMWGDAVNVASRMEQHGLPGQIQTTKEVVDNAGSDFTFVYRGSLDVKGKGVMDTFFLKSAKDMKLRRSIYQHWKPKSTLAMRSNSTND